MKNQKIYLRAILLGIAIVLSVIVLFISIFTGFNGALTWIYRNLVRGEIFRRKDKVVEETVEVKSHTLPGTSKSKVKNKKKE